jgi:hypothetical protein
MHITRNNRLKTGLNNSAKKKRKNAKMFFFVFNVDFEEVQQITQVPDRSLNQLNYNFHGQF